MQQGRISLCSILRDRTVLHQRDDVFFRLQTIVADIKEAFPITSIFFSTITLNELNAQSTINNHNLSEESVRKYVSIISNIYSNHQ